METVDVRLPLGALAPTAAFAHSKDNQPIGSDVEGAMRARLRRQRVAVCAETGLLAVANGRVVDLYQGDAIDVSVAAPTCEPNAPLDAHLPFAGQIVLGDHLEGLQDDQRDAVVHATCVAFVAPGFLLVAATASAVSPSTSVVWLCGFRMYARSVVVATAHRFAPSPLLVHCSFADRVVPGDAAIVTLDVVPIRALSTREAGAVLLLFEAPSKVFGVFQWAERFSDRVLSTASLPSSFSSSSASVLMAGSVSRDAQWVALSDQSGTVHVLDFTRFAWELAHGRDARSLGPTASGMRLVLETSSRMGRVSQRDHPLATVRLVCQTRTGAASCVGTALRWWRPELGSSEKRASLYLLMGQSDGALAVLMLKRETSASNHGYALKTVEIYPAIRALKNGPLLLVSEPEYRAYDKSFCFSTVSRTSWRQWNVGCALHEETDKLKLLWPTLTDSLGLRTHVFDHHDAASLLFLPSSKAVTSKLAQLTFREHQSASLWIFALLRDEIRVTTFIDRISTDKTLHGSMKSIPETLIKGAKLGDPEDEPTPPSPQHEEVVEPQNVQATMSKSSTKANSSSDGQHSVLTTLQDRYKLPAMADPRRSKNMAASSDSMNTSFSSRNQHRLTKDQYNVRLAAMAQRVDRLNTNLHVLRHSFQLFTEDVQRHMTFINNHLEQLHDAAAQGPSEK